MSKSAMFDDLKRRYEKNWCRKDQLVRFTELGAITESEYEEITGEDFPSDE